jgi:hypothetical protein
MYARRGNKVKASYHLALTAICIFFIAPDSINGDVKGGLILSGIDTLIYTEGYPQAMDFVLQRPCSKTGEDPDCYAHIVLRADYTSGSNPDVSALLLDIEGQGLFIDTGYVNLDSIKYAPPDDQMNNDAGYGLYRVFRIPPRLPRGLHRHGVRDQDGGGSAG